jgi:hypothetical protein
MNNCESSILPGNHVIVFDMHSSGKGAFIKATVLSRYGRVTYYNGNVCYDEHGNKFGKTEVWYYPDCCDVQFEDGRISKGHFTSGLKLLS